MKQFMDEHFLLESEAAKVLYHQYAKYTPIYDYHCHLSPKEIWEDRRYENITQMWLGEDHYKWRMMRLNGIPEAYITGDASDYDKFLAYAKSIERAVGNPLYHWTHLELQRHFGIYERLCEQSAKRIFEACNHIIQKGHFSVRQLLTQMHVVYIGTTDDPTDTLVYHKKLAADTSFKVQVKPTFRPDPLVEIGAKGFRKYIERLEEVVGYSITNLEGLKKAISERIHYFAEVGCCVADHGLSYLPEYLIAQQEVDEVFQKALRGDLLTQQEQDGYRSAMLAYCAKCYKNLGWVMQLHIGAMRNNSTKMFEKLGVDQGFDSVADQGIARQLSQLLNQMEKEEGLPKIVFYTLNPMHHYVIASMLGNFSTDMQQGAMQFGSAWWFGDHKKGMEEQMQDLASLGILGNFIGMLTDSRSFLSMPRHEYFRRILCNILGNWMTQGEVPYDMDYIGNLVQDICYRNIKKYLGVIDI